jgi:imidazolonepropionase-like amidohydrolase
MALSAELWISGGRLLAPRGPVPRAVAVARGRIAGTGERARRGARTVEAAGLLLVPSFIDAHVHLSVAGAPDEVARAELRGGLAAVLDLGEPEQMLPLDLPPLRVRFAGPLLTAPGGYPTRSWGRGGYGLELATPGEGRQAVQRLARAGARFAKLAFDGRLPLLGPEVARAAAEEAHRLGLRVAAHALEADAVRRALAAGADVLAHAPVEKLPEDLVREVGARRMWVISTLRAFGGGLDAIENLRRLRAAGARVVYGTDLGNEGTAPGIDAEELALLEQAGLSPREVIDAATCDAAELLGDLDLGHLRDGAAACVLGVPERALHDVRLLARPALVLVDGSPIPRG